MTITVEKIGNEYQFKANDLSFPCFVGKNGIVPQLEKVEGDMASPEGKWKCCDLFYRSDIVEYPSTGLPVTAITKDMGWCDDPEHSEYNHLVNLPYNGSHEVLWRDNGAYDIFVTLGYNNNPTIAGKGSAIFMHCIEDGKTFTNGCVALKKEYLIKIIPMLTPSSFVHFVRS